MRRRTKRSILRYLPDAAPADGHTDEYGARERSASPIEIASTWSAQTLPQTDEDLSGTISKLRFRTVGADLLTN